jgi:hypothetical protein
LKKYSEAFHKKEKSVRDMAESLQREAPDPQTRVLAGEFAAARAAMGNKYASALEAFTEAKGLNPRPHRLR